MASEILRRIKEDIAAIQKDIEDAEGLINAMREAGEDVSELERMLIELKTRKARWERMLKARGVE